MHFNFKASKPNPEILEAESSGKNEEVV